MDNLLKELWTKTLGFLKEEASPVGYKTWIESIEPFGLGDDSISLLAESELHKSMLEQRYYELIKNSLALASGKTYQVLFFSKEEADELPVPKQEEIQKEEESFNPRLKKFTFDNFVVGNSNKFIHAVCLSVAEMPASEERNPLFLYGGVGLGKTHLMMAIGNYIKAQNPKAKILYTTGEQFTIELIESLKNKTEREFREKYRNIDLLLMDDVQFIAGKDRTQEEFFHTYNAIFENNKQIVLTSDQPPKFIPSLEERIRSRFESGMIAEIKPPDYETRVAILLRKAQEQNVQIPEEIAMFIAEKITRNIRELEGVLNRLISYHGLLQKEINLELAKEAVKDYEEGDKKKEITPSSIIDCCSRYYRIPKEDIVSNKRPKEIAHARQVAMYLCRTYTDSSLFKIAKLFGKKDHSTVINAMKKVEQILASDSIEKEEIEHIIKDIKG